MNPGLPHRGWILYQLSHKGSPRILEWVAYPLSSRSSWPRNWTRVSCIAGEFFTNWTIREALFSPRNCLISFAQSQNRAKATGFISQTPCPIPVPAFLLVLGQQYKRTQGNFGGMKFIILIVVMVSWTYTYVITHHKCVCVGQILCQLFLKGMCFKNSISIISVPGSRHTWKKRTFDFSDTETSTCPLGERIIIVLILFCCLSYITT